MLDVETTGLDPDAEPIEVAVVGADGRVLLSSLLRPQRKIDKRAAWVHGLSDSDLVSAPSFAEIYPSLQTLLQDRDVISYGADFDRRALNTGCRKSGLPAVRSQWDCAAQRYAAWRGFTAALGIACEIEGIDAASSHRALADAQLVWHLIQRMANS